MVLNRRVAAADIQTLLLGGLRAADIAIIVIGAVLSYFLRHDSLDIPDLYVMAIVGAILLSVIYLQIGRLYVFDELPRLALQIGRLSMAWTAVMLSLIALAYFTRTSVAFSRAFAIGWFALSLAGFILVRLMVLVQIDRWRRAGRLARTVAIIGAGDAGEHLIRQIETQARQQYHIVGVFDDEWERLPDSIVGHKVRGSVDDLVRFVRKYPVDEVLVAVPWKSTGYLMDLMKKLKVLPNDVKLCPEYVGSSLPVRGVQPVAGIPMLSMLERPLSGWNLVLKNAEDRLVGALLLLALSPLLALIALAIKLDSPGPAFFRQRRYGFNNNAIVVWKFRTMRHEVENEAVVPQATRNDPRVTAVGRILRRTSLDELPQIFNVMRGEMSLVGPRPHAVAHNEQYATVIDDYLSRHRVKPGITGWAQVNGLRGETDTQEKMRQRVQHDLYYIDNWSFWFDLKILALTPFAAMNRNAY
jgi:putative colanic acid biosynthesis UDP-glucose lipid carrier transferase